MAKKEVEGNIVLGEGGVCVVYIKYTIGSEITGPTAVVGMV